MEINDITDTDITECDVNIKKNENQSTNDINEDNLNNNKTEEEQNDDDNTNEDT